tara:strand:+ start:196 stop:849 length:654 start_codon:yes stop_codon:yes gene_type:complete
MMNPIMNEQPVMICLCAGYSGESQAFITRGWRVIRIDNDAKVSAENPGTLNLDVLNWMDWVEELQLGDIPPVIIWASPPCQEFSSARGKDSVEYPSLALAQACKDFIEHMKPKYFIIENVRGAVKHFLPIFGKPTQVIGPFYLWGRFPHLNVHVEYRGRAWYPHSKAKPKTRGNGHWRFNGVPYNKWDSPQNAKIPLEISRALLEAIDSVRTLDDFI